MKHALILGLALSLIGLIGCTPPRTTEAPAEPATFLLEVKAGGLVVTNLVVAKRIVSISVEGGWLA